MLICVIALVLTAPFGVAEEVDVRVRMSWGEGQRRQWRGTITVTDGVLSEPRCLGFQADAPDELVLDARQLRFAQRIPVSFDGLDFRVIGPADALLTVVLVPVDDETAEVTAELRLADFLRAVPIVHESQLDAQQNRLQLQRAPGDRLRVRFERDSLVFAPGDEFVFEALPHALGLEEGTAIRCAIQLVTPWAGEESWKGEQHDVRVDAQGGTIPIGPVTIPLGSEGVYEVVISLSQRRFGDAIGRLGEAIVPSRLLMQRKVQLVVVDSRPLPAETGEWRLVEEIDSTNPKWWAKWVWLPPLKKLPGMAAQGPLGDQPLRVRDYEGERLKEIGPAGWHAAPIPIAGLGEPHILEIEYPAGLRQTLGISVLEPDAAGQVGTQGIDSGVDVSGVISRAGGMERHRLIFWPRTKTPWLLLTNRRADGPAAIGKMRVYAGPVGLPAGQVPQVPASGRRLAAVFLDKPLFAANFGAPEALDAPSQRSLTDWNTFYLGAIRFAEYLRHAGYTAAFVPVVSDGMTLFPTQRLDTTPKWDTGTFFVSGQDPLPKDILELLFRVFDREGLTLIPIVQFGAPLPELETALRREGNDWGGIPLIGAFSHESRAVLGRVNARKGLAPYYNPLDPRVQTAMRRITEELLERCASHPSFGGLSLQLIPFGYTQLPDVDWALDDATFARFAQETRMPSPPVGPDRFVARLALVRGELRDAWLKWRAVKIAALYGQLQLDVARARAGAELYLDLHELVAGRVVQSSIRPQLPERDEFRTALLRHGLDASLLSQLPGLVLLRPHRAAPLLSLPAQATNLELDQSLFVDDLFQSSGPTGTLVYHESQVWRVPEFDKVSPFGVENTYTRLTAHVSSAGMRSRAQLVRGLVTRDSTVLAAGGWMAPLGREDALRPLFQAVSSLPAQKFRDAKPQAPAPNIAVRTLARDNQTYVYLANATGLRAELQLDLRDRPRGGGPRMLPDRQPVPLTATSADRWTARLEPYDVVAFVVESPDFEIADWRVEFNPEDVVAMGRLVEEVKLRLRGLREPQPLAVLDNPGFEQPALADRIPGWSAARRPGMSVEVDDSQPRSGKSSLRMNVTGAGGQAHVRSNLFPLPKTGRLAFKARLRTSDASRQPPLRMAIEGELADGSPFYYRSQPLGVAVPTQWNDVAEEFVFHFVSLPAGTPGQLAVGFDMLGPGEVWIDDVEVFDLYFQDGESNELSKRVGSAVLQLNKGDYAACERFLQEYWPRFLLEFGPEPRLTQTPAGTTPMGTPAESAAPAPAPVAERPSRWKLPLKFPFY